MTITSTVKSQSIQADGSILVTEEHTDSSGQTYLQTYLSIDASLIEAVCVERGIQLGLELERREQVLQEATNFEIPLTPVEVMRRLSPTEWASFQASTDSNIVYFREVFNKTTQIYRNNPLTQASLQALVSAGILASERVSAVLA